MRGLPNFVYILAQKPMTVQKISKRNFIFAYFLVKLKQKTKKKFESFVRFRPNFAELAFKVLGKHQCQN